MKYTVRYHAGPYSGIRVVYADDEQEAKDKVKGMIRKSMTLPMYSDSYAIVSGEEEENED